MNTFSSSSINAEHPIVALASPRAKSALAIIRVCGKDCILLLEPFVASTHKALSTWAPNSTKFCRLVDPKSAQPLEEVMLCVYKAPHSYTGQDSIDITLHGSLVSIDNLLTSLYNNGFAEAAPGEFTRRAFLNGKLDLSQAEAVHSLIEAHSTRAHSLALAQLSGSVSSFIDGIKQTLSELAAICTVSLDYPDDEIQESTIIDISVVESLVGTLNSAIRNYDLTRIHREGAVVILAGRTNAGKSATFNALLREERAIVSDTHGTTRDFLESQIMLQDIPVRLYDTAGLRETEAEIEKEGIQRSYSLLASADLVLYTIDSNIGLVEEDYKELQQISLSLSDISEQDESQADLSKIIVLWNKIDLNQALSPPSSIEISQSKAEADRHAANAQQAEVDRHAANAQQTEPDRHAANAQQADADCHAANAQQTEPDRHAANAQQAEADRHAANAQQTDPDRHAANAQQTEPDRHAADVPATISAKQIVAFSALNYQNIDSLLQVIYQKLHNNKAAQTEDLSIISSLRQKQLLEACRDSLLDTLDGLQAGYPLDMISLDIGSALSSLGQITGEVSTEDILDLVFSNFCMGK